MEGANQSVNFWDFWVLGSKFTEFLSVLKQQIKFCINLQCHETQLLCTFLAENLYTFNKRSLSRYEFGEIESLKFGTFMGSFRQNNVKFPLKKYRRFTSHNTAEWYEVLKKMTCSFKYDISNFVNFHPTTQKFQNFNSMGYFCSKYMMFEVKKCGGVIFHDTEQWRKIWINPDLLVSKMAWGIGWTFIIALKNLKKCTLMDSFCLKDIMLKFHWRVMRKLKENWLVAWKMT